MELPNAVKISGAVSPATRAKASMQPVMMPGEAVFTVMDSTDRQFGNPSAQRGFANRVRHHQQHLFGGSRHRGNHHDSQRHTAGERREMSSAEPRSANTRQAHHNRRNAIQHIGSKPNRIRQLGSASEFGQKDACANADRNTDQRWQSPAGRPSQQWRWPCRRPTSPSGSGICDEEMPGSANWRP